MGTGRWAALGVAIVWLSSAQGHAVGRLVDEPAAEVAPVAPSTRPAEHDRLEDRRRSLDPTLRGIEAAVRAADPEAYLAWVDGAEPHFAREQRNWAADLRRHRPATFELRIVGLPNPEADGATDREIVCELEMTWSMPKVGVADDARDDAAPGGGGHAGPDPASSGGPATAPTTGGPGEGGWTRTVRFPARFTLAETGAARNPDGGERRWLFAGEAWRVLRSQDGRNTVCFADGFEDSARRVLELLPTARRRVDRLFGMNLGHEQVVKLYPDAHWLLASVYLSYKDPIGGWNEPGESIKLLARRAMNDRSTLALLAHEYGHVATFAFDEHASEAAWWAVEGIAEVCAFIAGRAETDDERAFAANDRFISNQARNRVVGWHRAGRLADWEAMADFRRTPAALGGHVYKQGEHLVGFIGERFGRERMIAWVRALAEGATVQDATLATLGLSFQALDGDWREAVAREAAERDAADAERRNDPGEGPAAPRPE